MKSYIESDESLRGRLSEFYEISTDLDGDRLDELCWLWGIQRIGGKPVDGTKVAQKIFGGVIDSIQ